MRGYVDEREKLVARIGGGYSPGVKKAPKALEVTDRRIYFSSASAPTKEDKKVHFVSSVVDVADVSSVTYGFDKPKGSFTLGAVLLTLSVLIGIGFGIFKFIKGGNDVSGLAVSAAVGIGAGVALLALCYAVTYFSAKSKRMVTVAIEYRGLILKADFMGVSDDKLDTFREAVMKAKEAVLRRYTPAADPDAPVRDVNVIAPNLKTEPFFDRPPEPPIERKPAKGRRKRADSGAVNVSDL